MHGEKEERRIREGVNESRFFNQTLWSRNGQANVAVTRSRHTRVAWRSINLMRQ